MTQDLTRMTPQRPSLYRLAADGRSLDFLFAQCPACHALSFPANAPGCMHCGHPAGDNAPVARPGGGTLLEYVTLHVPLVPGMPAPSIAGDIRIAPQVVEEGVIAVNDEGMLSPGMALRAVAVPLAGGERYGCAFVPEQEAAR
ncbi:Zn-ribbon domain-containing OB-fold protein [Variovorax paradoxus]|jgi:uncharacterized OB-fold protein|uniref:DUF35 domain-containing protein n=1 Tax=Variovorax paradoxus TaxID=34073 RepID=A0A679JF51_VARPD|nr:hypothetical protein VVAX_05650 [Variovorax paradoxus]